MPVPFDVIYNQGGAPFLLGHDAQHVPVGMKAEQGKGIIRIVVDGRAATVNAVTAHGLRGLQIYFGTPEAVRYKSRLLPVSVEREPLVNTVGFAGARQFGSVCRAVVVADARIHPEVKIAPLFHHLLKGSVKGHIERLVEPLFAGNHADAARNGIRSINLFDEIPEGMAGELGFLALQSPKIFEVFLPDGGRHAFIQFLVPAAP